MAAGQSLYLIRHGEAGNAQRDDMRELTQRGREHTRSHCDMAAPRLTQPIATLITSPYTRALQTAAIVHAMWQQADHAAKAAFLVNDCLTPDGTPRGVARFVDGLSDLSWPVVLVGHQPLFGSLLAWLTDRPELAGSVSTSSISALNVIAFAQGGASLDWQIL